MAFDQDSFEAGIAHGKNEMLLLAIRTVLDIFPAGCLDAGAFKHSAIVALQGLRDNRGIAEDGDPDGTYYWRG